MHDCEIDGEIAFVEAIDRSGATHQDVRCVPLTGEFRGFQDTITDKIASDNDNNVGIFGRSRMHLQGACCPEDLPGENDESSEDTNGSQADGDQRPFTVHRPNYGDRCDRLFSIENTGVRLLLRLPAAERGTGAGPTASDPVRPATHPSTGG